MIAEDITTFASLVAQVEDAGPGVMGVLRPLGMGPAQYAKMLAEWRARMERNPALQAAFDGALAAARRGELRVPLTRRASAGPAATAPAQQAASFQRAPVAGPGSPTSTVLTLEQHASMTAEIAARPDLAMATIGRYGLTPQAKRAADDHYRAAMAADGEVKVAWERAYRTHGEWLVKAGWTA